MGLFFQGSQISHPIPPPSLNSATDYKESLVVVMGLGRIQLGV